MGIKSIVGTAIIALGISYPALAEPAKSRLANGLATFVVPDGWLITKEPNYDLYVEASGAQADGHLSPRCLVRTVTLPNLKIRDQEQMNEFTRSKTAESFSPGRPAQHFSNTEIVDGIGIASYEIIEKGLTTNIKHASIHRGIMVSTIYADCTHRGAVSPADKQAIAAFLGSVRFITN